MSAYLNFHSVKEIKIEATEISDTGTEWRVIVITDAKGAKFEITCFADSETENALRLVLE